MNDQLQELKTRLGTAKSVLLIIKSSPSPDVVASSLALYLSLKESGKTTSIIASSDPLVRDSHLVGLDKITTDIGGNNLVITFNVPESSIDKVVSNSDNGHLSLMISPTLGSAPLTKDNLTFSYSGASADLVIVIGASDLSDLGNLTEKEVDLFKAENLVNISNQIGSFGSINITDPSSSCSELVTALIKELALPIDIDIAGNLMQGIEDATGGLSSPNMTADTFEALAVLYRTGARRSPPVSSSKTATIVSDMPIIEESIPSEDWTKPKIFKSGSTQ